MRIEAHDLGRRFGTVAVLQQVRFTIEPHCRVALIGPNGSGKSTLNRILMGLLTHEGHVRLDGRCPLRERVAIAHGLAYVPQIAPQLGAPVGDVVRAVGRLRSLACDDVRAVAGAFDLDLEAIAHLPFRSLSGGMKQKLLIALALSARASLLILDEPTASLDSRARQRFFEVFEELTPQATLLLCSHRLEEIRPLVHHVLMLEDGRLVYDGPVDAFLERHARATVDVWIRGEQAAAWLLARGFCRSARGVWRRTVDAAEKMKLLPELLQALGPALLNLNARDLETLDLGADPRGATDA
jgi:ABC-2 type transport system ATP-binding protein